MANPAPSSTLVFRDGKQTLPGGALLTELQRELNACQFASGDSLRNLLVSALLRAGELECGAIDLADSNIQSLTAKTFAALTDELAHALLDPSHARIHVAQAQRFCRSLDVPQRLTLSSPEGFCFYGLHPLDFADSVRRQSFVTGDVAVIGIRSIGTTLSAITAAALHRTHLPGSSTVVERTTVRPSGHPFDRTTSFSADQAQWIRRMAARHAAFVVVDEGPGLSGSSFISVGEALLKLGVDPQRIHFVGTRPVDPSTLVARDAATRWSKFRFTAVAAGGHRPLLAEIPAGGGQWRHLLEQDEQAWPAVWTFISSPAYLSKDRQTFFKFEGLGRYGAAVHARASLCAEAGFSPPASSFSNGYAGYPLIAGRLLAATGLTPKLLQRIASYLAFRANAMPHAVQNASALEAMTRHNTHAIIGHELPADFSLPVERPVVADARMMPHEWLRTAEGKYLKLDVASHGDNHFFPGACDIAWDLAGTIVEWELSADAAGELLALYESAADDARPRIDSYVIAYCAFHAGYAAMAANSMSSDPAEQPRLLRDYHRYRTALLHAAAPRAQNARAA